MLTEAYRTCALGPSCPSVRPGSPGPAGRAVRARGFLLARARKVVFARDAREGCARPRIQPFTKELGCVCDRTKNEVSTAYGANTCLLGTRVPPVGERFLFSLTEMLPRAPKRFALRHNAATGAMRCPGKWTPRRRCPFRATNLQIVAYCLYAQAKEKFFAAPSSPPGVV